MSTINHPLIHGNTANHPTRIVVHAMGEYILDPKPVYAPEFLDGYELSAHVLVCPNGDLIRCRDDLKGAWHARGSNGNRLGIEFLVEGEHTYATFLEALKTNYVTDAQWEAGLDVVKGWFDEHPIERIDRHSDLSPGRKVDPGEGFNWAEFLDDLEVH